MSTAIQSNFLFIGAQTHAARPLSRAPSRALAVRALRLQFRELPPARLIRPRREHSDDMSNVLWRCGSKGFHLHRRRQVSETLAPMSWWVGTAVRTERTRMARACRIATWSVSQRQTRTRRDVPPALLPATVTPAAATAGSLWLSGLNERFGRQPAGLPGFTMITEPSLSCTRHARDSALSDTRAACARRTSALSLGAFE